VSFFMGSSLVAAPLVIVLLVGWGAGLAVQYYMGKSGADKKIGGSINKLIDHAF
jgi:hypothetical protein